jgi:hypothetical protein
MLERVVPTLDALAYPFSPNAEWEALTKRDPAAGMRVYWLEILYRAHWAAATSLIRADRWLRGIQDGDRAGNLMVFAASLRGFLESSADTNDALNAVPFTLAEHYEIVSAALAGKSAGLAITELEERFLAFTFASKSSPRKESVYAARNPFDHLAAFKREEPSITQMYADLCDIVHPGMSSVLSYSLSADGIAVYVSQSAERPAIDQLRERVPAALRPAIVLGVTNMVLLLKVLNVFKVPEVETPIVDHVNMNGRPGWEKAKNYLRAKGWNADRV